MQWPAVIAMLFIFVLTGCGGDTKAGARSAAEETMTPGSGSVEGEDPDAPPAVPCETSDDCAEGQFCVDDECALPAPAGFY